MRVYYISALFVLFAIAIVERSAASENRLCEHVVVMDGKLKLNDNERVLVCGTDRGGEGWKTIPLPQVTLQLKSILQNQGYLAPRFERDVESIKVWLGERSKISNLRVEGAIGVLHSEKKRKIVGYPMEPAQLNEVEAWAYGELRKQGYACAKVTIEAHEWDREVVVFAGLPPKKRIGKINVGDLDGLNPDVLNRYRPFEGGEIYDIRLTQLMASRLLADGLFQSAYFTVKCHEDLVDLTLETAVGRPKIFRFGVGASTEEFPVFLDATFKNARLDDKASAFTINGHASNRKVKFDLGSELYWIPGSTRSFFGPRFKVERKVESSYETNLVAGGADIGRNWDFLNVRLNGRWGATLNYTKKVAGIGPTEAFYPTIDGSLAITNHDYEASVRDQYEGWNAQFFYRGQNKGLGSKLDANRYRFDLKSLWNVGGFSPPLFVFGTRLEAITVDADELTGSQNRDLLPVEDRIYLGGDQNLRGFGRQSINNANLGYLSSLYLGFELRLVESLPYKIQPFLLFDAAKVGNQRYTLDPPVFASEGLGIRWASPFGTLRGSIARGHVIQSDNTTVGYDPQWVFFGSFGQEF